MKKFLILLLAVLVVSGCSQNDEQEGTTEIDTDKMETEEQNTIEPEEQSAELEEMITLAETFIDLLALEQYEDATSHFDETMKTQLTPDAMEELWLTLEDQAGEFIDQEYMSIEESEGYQVVLINGLFAGSDVVFSITFDANKQIAGFYVY